MRGLLSQDSGRRAPCAIHALETEILRMAANHGSDFIKPDNPSFLSHPSKTEKSKGSTGFLMGFTR
jgi:hypothetical protein